MTTPNEPGSNDEVIRIVYQAVADYSQLLRETRKAQQETKALKADIDGLTGTTTAKIKVTADTTAARTELAQLVKDVMIKARVVLDAAAAKTEIAQATRDTVVKVKVAVDALAAKPDLAAVLKDTAIKARLTVDAAAAKAEIARVVRDAVVKVKVVADSAALAGLSAQLARIKDLSVKVAVTADQGAVDRLRATLARLRDLVVKVAVAVDDAALTRLRTALARLRDATVNVGLDIDQAALAALSARLSQLHADIRVGVDFDEAALELRFRAILAHLESLGPIRLHVDLDQSIFARIAELEARLDALQRRRRDDDDSGGGGGGGGGSSAKAAQLPEGLTTAAGFIAKFVGLAALAVPVIAGLTVAVGGLAAGLLAAGATAAVFAVGAVGAFSKVTEAVKAYEKSGTIASGPVAAVVAQFETLKDRYNELQKSVQGDVFAVFSHGLSIAADLLDKVQDLVGSSAQAVDGALGQVKHAIDGAGFEKFLAFVGRDGPAAVSGFVTGLLGFAGGIGRLIMAFEPFETLVVGGFAKMGTSFDRWTKQLDGDSGFQRFLAYGKQELPKVIDLIKNLATFAGHLFVALEPIGSVLLNIADAAVKFLSGIDPHILTAVVGAALAFAAAIKIVQGVLAVQGVITTFTAGISKLAGSFGAAGGGAATFGGALAGLGAALGIGAAVLVLNHGLQLLADQQKEAADAADRHAAALKNVGQALADGASLSDKQVRAQQYDTLTGLSAEGKAGGFLGLGQTKETVQFTDVAKAAGISADDLVTGSLGIDPKVQSQNIGKLEAYRRQLLDQAAAGGKNKESLLAQADAVEKLETQYGAQSLQVGEAADAAKDYKSATDGSTDSTKKSGDAAATAAGQYHTQAAAADAVKKALKADFSSDANVQKYDAAEQAMAAYDAQLQAVKDAETQYTEAQTAATRAQEDLNQARLDAVQRIKDLQRSLRDMALDEEQAKLSAKESDESLNKLIAGGASADEIEQARIDNERAHNSLNDLEQDKAAKKKAATDELSKGIAGNRELQDAITSNAAAQTNLAKAHTALTTAVTQLTSLHLAFQAAASQLGLTEGQVRKLKTNMDGLKDKTVNIVLNTSGADAKLAACCRASTRCRSWPPIRT